MDANHVVQSIVNNGNALVDECSNQSTCQKLYIESGCNKKLLLAMCIGLSTSDAHGTTRKLANLSEEPYALAKDKKKFKFTNEMLCHEVIRQAKIQYNEKLTNKIPRPSSWPYDTLLCYLVEFPNNKMADVMFLQVEEKKFVDALSIAVNVDKIQAANTSILCIVFNWLADLRVVHVLIDDNVKAAYLARHNACDRGQLDG